MSGDSGGGRSLGISIGFLLVSNAVEVLNSLLQRISGSTDNDAVNTTVLVLDTKVKDVVLRICSFYSLNNARSDSGARNTETHVTQFIGQNPIGA